MTDHHIDLEPLTRGAARLVLAALEDDGPGLNLASRTVCEMPDNERVAILTDLISGWTALMCIALRDEGLPLSDLKPALTEGLRIHLGRDITS